MQNHDQNNEQGKTIVQLGTTAIPVAAASEEQTLAAEVAPVEATTTVDDTPVVTIEAAVKLDDLTKLAHAFAETVDGNFDINIKYSSTHSAQATKRQKTRAAIAAAEAYAREVRRPEPMRFGWGVGVLLSACAAPKKKEKSTPAANDEKSAAA